MMSVDLLKVMSLNKLVEVDEAKQQHNERIRPQKLGRQVSFVIHDYSASFDVRLKSPDGDITKLFRTKSDIELYRKPRRKPRIKQFSPTALTPVDGYTPKKLSDTELDKLASEAQRF